MARGSDKVVNSVPILGEKFDDERIGRVTEQTTTNEKKDYGSSRDVVCEMEFRLARMELAFADSQDTVRELYGDFKELVTEKEELLARVLELETSADELQEEVQCALNNSDENENLEVGVLCGEMIQLKAKVGELEEMRCALNNSESLQALAGVLCAEMIELKAKVAELEVARVDGAK